MLSDLFGGLWVLIGLWWLIKPESLRNRLQRKLNRRMKFMVYGFVFMFGILILGSVIKVQGLVPKIIGVFGMFLAIKAIVAVTSKTSEKFIEWWGSRSLAFFRVWAGFFIAVGAYLIFA